VRLRLPGGANAPVGGEQEVVVGRARRRLLVLREADEVGDDPFGEQSQLDVGFLRAPAQQVERRVAIKRAIKRAEKVAMDMGVDGIVSDRTDLLKQVFTERGIWEER